MISEVMGYSARFSSDQVSFDAQPAPGLMAHFVDQTLLLPSSQRLFTRFYLEHPDFVELDHSSKMFYMLHSTVSPLIFDGSSGHQVQTPDVGAPPVVHANAGDGKAFYDRMVSSWREAKRLGQPTVAINQPYFHGINHFNRGENVLALVSFLSHMANFTLHLEECVFNLAFTFHRLHEVSLARLFYLRSLNISSEEIMNSAATNLALLEHTQGTLDAAYWMVTEALLRDPSSRSFHIMREALRQFGPDNGVKVHHHAATTSASKQIRDAYLHAPDNYDLLDGPLSQLCHDACERLHLSEAFHASSYYQSSFHLCRVTEPPPSSSFRVYFPFARVMRLFFLMQESRIQQYCEEFQAGLLGVDYIPAHVDNMHDDSNLFDISRFGSGVGDSKTTVTMATI